MKKTILLFLSAFFYFTPFLKADAAVAVLWIPSAENQSWTQVYKQARSVPNFKFTAALYDKMVPATLKKHLIDAVNAEQIEIALRIDGDPLLPLLYIPGSKSVNWEGKEPPIWNDRIDEAGLRIFDAYSQYETYFRESPKGFLSSFGSAAEELIPVLEAYSLSWTAAGTPENKTLPSIKKLNGVAVINFNTLNSIDDFDLLLSQNAEHAVFIVIDESDPTLDQGKARDLFLDILNTAKNNEIFWTTVNEALTVYETMNEANSLSSFLESENDSAPAPAKPPLKTEPPVSSPSPAASEDIVFTPWVKDYSPWAASKTQRTALKYSADAVLALSLLKNSTDLRKSSALKADDLIHKIETNANYFKLGNPLTRAQAEGELKDHITQLYKLMAKPLPPGLLQPFSQDSEQEAQKGVIHLEYTQNSVTFTNARKNIKLPKTFVKLDEKDTPEKAFEIAALNISWTDFSLIFTITFHESSKAMFAKYADKILLDIYIDQNKRANFGLKQFLKDRNFITSNDNPWEYALSLDAKQAKLYQSGQNAPLYLQSYTVTAKDNGFSVSVPRSVIRGTPLNWAYCLVEMVKSTESGQYFYPEMFDDTRSYTDYMALDKNGRSLYFLSLPANR